MFSKVYSTTITGITAYVVTVEVDVGRGLPVFDMGGYLSTEVKEAKERVRIALRNSGYEQNRGALRSIFLRRTYTNTGQDLICRLP